MTVDQIVRETREEKHNNPHRKDLKDVMFQLMKELDKKGFIIHYLQAYSTPSCYVKLDFGVANSIRVSDHKGIEKYQYRFNLMLNIDKSYEKDGRMYYCLNDMDKLVHDVVDFKNKQLEKYKFNYYEYMLREKKNKENKTGFWQRARSFNE